MEAGEPFVLDQLEDIDASGGEMIHFLGFLSVLEYLGSLQICFGTFLFETQSHLSSSGMWIAIMETGSSLRSDHPRMSESLRAWFTLKGIMMTMILS